MYNARRYIYPAVHAGDIFNRLTVLSPSPPRRDGKRRYLCQCSCGSGAKVIAVRELITGGSKSCGCLVRETNVKRNTTHGKAHVPEHAVWASMKARCGNPNNKYYHLYGGRGIKVCDAWSDSFEAFLADMGSRPSPDHSIDRIDGNGNYESLNCRWADRTEQVHNRRGRLGQYHTISPGVFTTTKDILAHNVHTYGLRSADIFKGYSINFARNFFQYCKDTIPNFDEAACIAFLEKHKGIYLIEDLKKVEVGDITTS